MNAPFDDITDKISVPPTWWDSNGTPRYCTFEPKHCPNIYADEMVLLEVQCQACGTLFPVEMHRSKIHVALGDESTLHDLITTKAIHYGDPPHHDCPAGNTMNVYDRRVLEYWKCSRFDWQRDPQFEIMIEDPADDLEYGDDPPVPTTPREQFGAERTFLSDDADLDPQELVVFQGGNNDWYISIRVPGEKLGPAVRLRTSGGASASNPGLPVAAFRLWQKMKP